MFTICSCELVFGWNKLLSLVDQFAWVSLMICEDSFYVVTEVHISLAAVERGDDLYFARGARFVCSDGEEDAPSGPGCKWYLASFTRNLENLNPCVSL